MGEQDTIATKISPQATPHQKQKWHALLQAFLVSTTCWRDATVMDYIKHEPCRKDKHGMCKSYPQDGETGKY